MTMQFQLTVNKKTVGVEAAPTDRLSNVLRNHLNLSGTKVGCDAGDCGACTVLVDGKLVCACLTACSQATGADILTVEGLANGGTLNRLQESFLRYGAAQCGICTPGMLISSLKLLEENPCPTKQEVEDALGGVLCRCTGYKKIVDAIMNAHLIDMEEEFPAEENSIGKPLLHLDGIPKVTGHLVFGADDVPENSLYAYVIRSPHHSAYFKIGNKQKFLATYPGVELVLDAGDIPGCNKFGVIPPFADQPVFAEHYTRFRGEAVAAIIGTRQALDGFVDDDFPIEWEKSEHVLTPGEAVRDDAENIHSGRKGNVLTKGLVTCGNAESGLEAAIHNVTISTITPFIEHAYIEPEAGFAVRRKDRIEVYGCTQAAQMDREEIAEILGIPIDAVRVRPSACGGGFGSKLDVSFQPIIALAAWKLHRPVAISYSRRESLQSTTKRHPSEITVAVGCDENGIISGFDFVGVFNTGAYASWGPTVANRVPVHASGPYHVSNYTAKSVAVHTNTAPSGAFRGFGVPQSAIAQELAFDLLADKAAIDPLEFRIKNALRNNQPTVTGQVFEEGVGIIECLQSLKSVWIEARQKAEKFNQENGADVIRKGVGIGTCWYGCGNTSLPNPSTIRFGITALGKIVLHQGAMDIGQGSNTVITQIAAEALGIPVHQIQLVDGDTDLTPDCGKTSASRQTFVTGKAAKLAGESLRKKVLRLGNVSDDATITFRDGTILLSQSSETIEVSLAGLKDNEFGYVLMAEETYDPPTEPLDEKGQGIPYAVYGYGAQVMELTVDTQLGTIKLDKITTAHDVGRAINPMLVEGQIEGGVAQGIGLALMEEYIPGQTENLHDYLIPTFGDMPEFEHKIIEVPDAEGPYGAKGLGEHVLIPTAPAILNAIRHATGALVTDLPATPHKVLAAITISRQGMKP